jgi:hypothetical protein
MCCSFLEGVIKMGRMIKIFSCLAIAGLILLTGTNLFAQRALSGAELENACQTYADKAVKYAKEWETRQCSKKLDYYPQLMDTDRIWHYNRCIGSAGSGINTNLKLMEDDLKKCPGDSGNNDSYTAGTGYTGTGNQGGNNNRPDNQPPWDNSRRDTPLNSGGNSGSGEIWDIIVINSADLARSYHTFKIPSLNGIFTAQNMNPAGGPDFRGQMNGSVFEAQMTDNTGYVAKFIGHGTMSGDIEGTGCDNRNRSYSFTMKRR